MRPRRALLYVPGSDLHKIEKAAALGADCVVLDLEDGVAEGNKTEARQIIASALHDVNFGRSERLVRINGFPSGRTLDDLGTVLPAHPDGILLPKVDRPEQIQNLDEQITNMEKENAWPLGEIVLIAIVESALGMVNLEAICRQSEIITRFQGIVFGSEDFTADMGATRTPAALELLYARSRLVMYAAAFGLQAIDMVTVNYKESEVLLDETRRGVELGYSGKQIIHPAQIEPVQTAFTPSEKEIAYAAQVLEEARRYASEGKGAFTIGNQMVDMPVIKRAESILARARASK